jgi:hypothetical protein
MYARLRSNIITKRRGMDRTLPALSFPVVSIDWLAGTVIVAAIITASIIFLRPSPLEFPMDDTYIHFVYAENLSGHGGLFFNSPSEKGVGTSSLLWVLILAAGNWAGFSMHWVAKLVGVASLAIVGIGLYSLLRPLLPAWVALSAVLLVVLSGHMLWFALSGMETMLFLALGILALLCYRQQRWGWLGIVLGLLILTRLEGAVLALVIGLFDIWRYRAVRRGLLISGLVSALICFPWLLHLWSRTGDIIPTSGSGKHFSMVTGIQVATKSFKSIAWLSYFPALAYPLTWTGYMIEFILGGFALPAPYLHFSLGLGSFSYKLSIWAILGLVTVVLPLMWISLARLMRFLKTPGWAHDQTRLPLLLLLIWMVLNNLVYMIYLPSIGTASRYAVPNHIVLWLSLGLGLWFVHRTHYVYWLAAGLSAIALANMVYWNRVYDANLEHMLNVRIAAAEYMRENLAQRETCAATDIGALRYYSQRPLVDLGGLVDPGLGRWYMAGKLDQYLIDNGVSCLVLPGRTGTTTDGVFDIAKELGLSNSKLFELKPVKVFQIDRERWLVGYYPVINYQATVTIYNLIGQ